MNEKRISAMSNRETIELFLVSEPGSVPLTAKQEELLSRWQYADELIRRNDLNRDGVAKMIIRKFGGARTSAYQDIVNAEAVFASSTPLNKKYHIQLRIDFLVAKINEMYGDVRLQPDIEDGEKEDELSRIFRESNNTTYYDRAIALEKVLQKYYHDYPDLIMPRSPKTIVFNIQNNSLPAPTMGIDDALTAAKNIVHLKAKEDGTTDPQS